jgi:hypothetical protein
MICRERERLKKAYLDAAAKIANAGTGILDLAGFAFFKRRQVAQD